MQDKGFQPAGLFQRLYLFADTANQVQVEVLQHGGDHHERHVLAREGKRQMRPPEVVVLYVEVLFTFPARIVEYDDVLFRRIAVVGKDAAVRVCRSEQVCLHVAVLVPQRASLYGKPV